ncbi:PREDICTED: putative disease resistance protein RGA3 isoform X1 [Theobroma cacao]|uniref:Disease resistance protein RGA3 isoform X1 n=1 Tax=Theobroma cacao TaxID=3641 RepID=A0AB32W8L6_THECC|nr:PREDICTED: putative disease resistance protein RGA3 isoform X1 [Theobroma cacao]XP_017974223.1 PREDICTED: putative disease resistance protein RGA3 isoform X1 [Theobroma cacao]XP_017974224.1 PREDICTED: putative disease resistance protein RGA3 isoform X1 [Theobroma cacao]XP_017974225.1 PREDICTED: putative disease resistance protein RGA3 isoform X1 [Theobroma cacao]XP_017974226.1 PREDICTED: putative disease resistance protein RGA3 isoform X1 [Theobroma cacao]XP_017974227.1 PREDICTED: putative 
MAEAAMVVAKGIVSGLSSVASEQIKIAWTFEDELKRLQDSLAMIQDVLQDAEDQQGSQRAVRRWLLKLREVAYEADDVLDELVYEDLRREIVTNKPMCSFVWKQVCNFFSLSNPVLFHFLMANKVEKINESLDKIKNEGVVLGLRNRPVGRITVLSQDIYETDSILDSEPIIGRRYDVSKIVNMLSSLSNQHEISVISIVGMPGLGKTTLARTVCKEVKEKKMFDVVIWVCVSYDFSHQKILGGMLESLDRSAGGMSNIDAILSNLQKELKDKSFLLILDDVWIEDDQMWRELKNRLSKTNDNANELSLQKKNKANAIVVTTRSHRTASIVETSPDHRHNLEQLSREECWSIIKERACRIGGALVSVDLEDIGKEIAEKCGGVALLASVLGGTLGFRRRKEEWLTVKNSDVLRLGNNDEVLPKLKLSFDNLPFCLKQCFAYCSIFPKGHVIEKDQLIQLWMAQGFLQSFEEIMWSEEGGVTELEDVGDKFFNGLLSNSLFQDVQRDTCGNIQTCKMHDVVHDLAQFVSQSELIASELTSELTTDISDHVRHLNVAHVEALVPRISEDVARKLRSLFSKVNVFNDELRDFKSLRILNFCDAKINDLPTFLGRVKHLRYLDVSGTSIKELPQSIDRLYNLQTLRFMHCRHLELLPKGLGNLVSLRHIYFNDEKLMPVQIGCLTSLRTLPLFVVGVEIGCQIKELGCLNHLRGDLTICKLEYVKDGEEARGANLQAKTNIYKLIYEWSIERESCDDHEEVAIRSDPNWSYRSFNYDREVLDDLQSYSSDQSFNYDTEVLDDLQSYSSDQCFGQDELTDDLDEISTASNPNEQLRDWLKFLLSSQRSYEPSTRFNDEQVLRFNDEQVLEGLEPPISLKSLSIKNFRGENFPPWIWRSISVNSTGSDSLLLDNLVELNLFNCMNCESLPRLGKLRNLKILAIKNMNNVRCIGGEFYSYYNRGVLGALFPVLKELTIEGMETLKTWMDPTRLNSASEGDSTSIEVFPCLEDLTVGCCPQLEMVPMMGGLPSLQTLKIYSCEGLTFIGDGLSASTCLKTINIQDCPSLKKIPGVNRLSFLTELEVKKCSGLHSLPRGISHCTSLENLSIRDCTVAKIGSINALSSLRILVLKNCKDLKRLPRGLGSCTSLEQLDIVGNFNLQLHKEEIRQLPSVRFLNITICPKLRTIPKGWLGRFSNLKVLTIGGFSEELDEFPGLSSSEELDEFPGLSSVGCLPASLDYLLLLGWKRLGSLPEQLQHLSALKRLEIWSFDGVEALPDWLGNLSSLQSLKIHQCEKLMCLPSAQAMQQLTQLKRLFIHNCPILSGRCAQEGGPEWFKISRIPEVIIKNND